jgi:hypothetical protein
MGQSHPGTQRDETFNALRLLIFSFLFYHLYITRFVTSVSDTKYVLNPPLQVL